MYFRAAGIVVIGLAMISSAVSEPAREPGLAAAALTQGPKFHWFGYYDKLQCDPGCRYVLGMEVDFEHRSPTEKDTVKIGMVDLREGNRWIELGESRAWCWQQGCMLQWRPQSKTEILWNDRDGEHFVCRILDVKTRKMRTVPHPVYAVSPDGKTAVSADFRRINEMRPGYGYTGLSDPYRNQDAPTDSGIFRVDLQSGKCRLIISLAKVAKLTSTEDDGKHYFNHLLVGPEGSRFIFLHRIDGSRNTRMLTAAMDGSDIRLIDASGKTSHFIWRDSKHILAWTRHESLGRGFYLFEDKTGGTVETVGEGQMTQNGHCTYLPGGRWILSDSYPMEKTRNQHVYLYDVQKRRKVAIGRFHSPPQYKGEWRCDTHPRCSPDGKYVVIDSPHGGNGRQMYMIDISRVVNRP